MARDVIGGDAIFDWTIWHAAAIPLCADRRLVGRHREICEEFGQEYEAVDARCDAESYALALSRLGWCLRDVGALCAAHEEGQLSFAAGLPRRWWPGCRRPMPGWRPAG